MYLHKKNDRVTKTQSGFTLVELAFVITIFAVMASIVLFKFKDFGSKTQLDNLAEDIALQVNQAQRSAISGALTSGISGVDDVSNAPRYGMYFTDSTVAGANKQFSYFADTNHDYIYEAPGVCTSTPTASSDGCLAQSTLTTELVSNLCFISPTAGGGCLNSGSLHITFTRPFPDAQMHRCAVAGAVACDFTAPLSRAYVEVTSGTDAAQKRTVVVTSLGEVHVVTGAASDACAADNGSSC